MSVLIKAFCCTRYTFTLIWVRLHGGLNRTEEEEGGLENWPGLLGKGGEGKEGPAMNT